MIFEKLCDNHIEAAARLAISEYAEEREAVPVLPDGDYFDLFCSMISKMTDHSLGVVAMENGEVTGFLTCYEPIDNFFGTVMGVFSPIHAHAARKYDRRRIYSLLYQNAAELWVSQGILSHAAALYAHDNQAVNSFFRNGFGLRCIDAVRGVNLVVCNDFPGYSFYELPKEDVIQIVPLKNSLIGHMTNSPCFMPRLVTMDLNIVTEESSKRGHRYFAAFDSNKAIAFIEITAGGENFACDDPLMSNICGAYMLPEYRGTGIYEKLLSFLIDTLAKEGYTRCGVDFESINPTASGFWLKHFTAYTHSVVRRIDERIY